MEVTKAAIVVNGEINDYDFAKEILDSCSYIVACDGGLKHCHAMGIKPNYIVGDFDSVSADILNEYKEIPKSRFSAEKDFTDMELAIEHVCDEVKSVNHLVILGALGKRLDHQMANIFLLQATLNAGLYTEIIDESTKVLMIDKSCKLHKRDGNLVSLLPVSSTVNAVVTDGLKYPLNSEDLFIGFARGISNLIIDEIAKVSVENGTLLVIQTKEYKCEESK
ncbi:MAG: thiamine diphosphokinase [Defluviitaleaceae bacterium]|nr:thiamine diphosphokinase [Defluviitaleaceae bacterium]